MGERPVIFLISGVCTFFGEGLREADLRDGEGVVRALYFLRGVLLYGIVSGVTTLDGITVDGVSIGGGNDVRGRSDAAGLVRRSNMGERASGM